MSTREDAIDHLIEAVIVDAYGDDEQLEAFVVAFGDHIPLPSWISQPRSTPSWRISWSRIDAGRA